MNHQAQRKQDLELWQVVEPPRGKGTQRRTNVQRHRNAQRHTNVQRRTNARTRQRTVSSKTNIQVIPLAPNPNLPKRSNSGQATAQTLRRRRARQRKVRFCRSIAVMSLLALGAVLFFFVIFLYQNMQEGVHAGRVAQDADKPVFLENLLNSSKVVKPEIQEDFLSISEYNRPGTTLTSVKNIFVHYTANPRTTAAQNRSYFEGLAQTHERAASAHFIIGCEGEVIQCIPMNEEAYAVIGRNNDSLSIECCYISEDGAFTQETYDSLVHMLAWLLSEYDLETQDILRHYDCGEKLCPLYYVEHEDAWEKLLYDVGHYTGV